MFYFAGMLHLNFEGIIHRDLAARNCLLTAAGDVKVSDFGMSRFAKGDHASQPEVGPLKWMAPESIRDSMYTEKTDVYSFGVVIYEILTQKEPWEDQNAVNVATSVALGQISLDLPDSAAPEFVIRLMRDCLKYDPKERPNFKEINVRLSEEI
jgi:serine/threonine protein kinase